MKLLHIVGFLIILLSRDSYKSVRNRISSLIVLKNFNKQIKKDIFFPNQTTNHCKKKKSHENKQNLKHGLYPLEHQSLS